MQESEFKIEVMLDIFSGRPNPTWQLSENQVDELREKLGTFRSAAEPKAPPGLGYRGVRLTNAGKIAEIPDRIVAYNGVLAITEKGMTKYCDDLNKIEEWLLDQARKQGYGEAIQRSRQYSPK